MKVSIDNVNKTIVLEDFVNVYEFLEFLTKALPNGEWKTYSIQPTLRFSSVPPIDPSPGVVPMYPPYGLPYGPTDDALKLPYGYNPNSPFLTHITKPPSVYLNTAS